MSFSDVDLLVSVRYLKSKIAKWKMFAIIMLCSLIAMIFGRQINISNASKGSKIARISINGIITEEGYKKSRIKYLADNDNYAAVIINVNSPGGSMVGSEIIYNDIKYISQKKPVVISMGSTATSGAYFISLAADRIFAYEGTITGSIGAIIQSLEFTEMLEKIGIKPIIIRKPHLKASMSMYEKMTEESKLAIDGVISDVYKYFASVVSERRGIQKEKLSQISDGRVYTARQALKMNLIDQIGGEKDILKWLKEEKSIDLPVQDLDINSKSIIELIPLPKKISSMINKSQNNNSISIQMLYSE